MCLHCQYTILSHLVSLQRLLAMVYLVLVVVGLAVQVWHTLIVPAQILGQYSEDEGVPWTTYRIADL